MTGNRKAIVWLAATCLVAVVLLGWRSALRYKYERARVSWKAETLPRLARLSMTNEEVLQEFAELKSGPAPNMNFRWAHHHVILMTNGEYLVYASRHGFNSGFVDHLFLGHGSDGRWLYSTYHFCNGLAGVIADDPPGSISEFATRYSAREFDGKSDECLQHTWPLKK